MTFALRASENTERQKVALEQKGKPTIASNACIIQTYQQHIVLDEICIYQPLRNMKTSALILAAALATASAQEAYMLRGERFLSVSTKAEKVASTKSPKGTKSAKT